MGNATDGAGWETKDSGQRQEFESGARRDVQEGKGRYDLMSPFAQARKAGIYERGATKYGDRNFEKGMPLSRFLDSAERHIAQYKMGKKDEDHLGQAAWNLDALMHTEAMIELGLLPAELNDLPDYIGKAEASQEAEGLAEMLANIEDVGIVPDGYVDEVDALRSDAEVRALLDQYKIEGRIRDGQDLLRVQQEAKWHGGTD